VRPVPLDHVLQGAVVPPSEYQQWLAAEEAAAPISDTSPSAAARQQINPGVPVKPSVGVGVN